MKTRKIILLFLTLLAGSSSLSMLRDPSWELLTEDDFRDTEQDAASGPAIEGPLGVEPHWESYDQWRCFSTDRAEVRCADTDYDGIVPVPSLSVVEGDVIYDFGMEPTPRPDCDAITAQWRELLEGEPYFCVYAAFLQTFKGDHFGQGGGDDELWIVGRLRTRKGQWSDPFMYPDSETEIADEVSSDLDDDIQ